MRGFTVSSPAARSLGCVLRLPCLLLGLTSLLVGQSAPSPNTQSPPTLSQTLQIRRPSVEQANRGYPVPLRAVVTFFDQRQPASGEADSLPGSSTPGTFVQDSSGGTVVNTSPVQTPPQAGDLIEIEGFSEQPDVAPQIGKPHWRTIVHARLPTPHRTSFERMASSAEDSQ